jgi:endoglycosylceramidase
MLPLHVTRGSEARITDAQGRQVLLRGVDLNVLGDYYQANPSEPPVVPWRDTDLDAIARQGFDVIRLVLSWSSLEPRRGVIDYSYLARVKQLVDAAGERGIYVVLDMHQDAWGKYIATPAGVQCPAGTEAAIGWDGAPEWATITDGGSTCRVPGIRELSPAVINAFENFYNNRDGIQDQLVWTWFAVAREFASDPVVAGYDLLNEPHFGADANQTNIRLAAFYRNTITVMRAAEQQIPHGFPHIVFFEPNILWSAVGVTDVPDASFTDDPNIVFAPHLYGGSLSPIGIPQGFDAAQGAAAGYRTTVWSGEWGWFGTPSADVPNVEKYAREEDAHLWGGAWWQWVQACGDPHSIGHPDGPVPGSVQVFNVVSCPGNVDEAVVPQWAMVLSRPYPHAAPGRLTALVSDPETDNALLSGVGCGELDLWAPARTGQVPVVTSHATLRPRMSAVPGGWRIGALACGSYAFAVNWRVR